MAIPKSVAHGLTSGVVGEISHAGPIRAIAAILSSTDENKIFSVEPTPTKMIQWSQCKWAVKGRSRGS